MSKSEYDKLFESLNLDELKANMLGMAGNLLTGEDTPTETVQTTIEVPKPIYTMVSKTCEIFGADADKAFGEMASRGLKVFFENLMKMANSVKKEVEQEHETKQTPLFPNEALGDLNPKFQELLGGVQQIKDIAKQLEQVQKAFDNEGQNSATKKDIE